MNTVVEIPIYMAPLSFDTLDKDVTIDDSKAPTEALNDFVRKVLNNEARPLLVLQQRYAEISSPRSRPAFSLYDEPYMVPNHPYIMGHIIRPLREAKLCYVLGMPVACIAQAGLVGEMVALWKFKMVDFRVDGQPIDEQYQQDSFVSTFDKLGQERRVRALKAAARLDDETFNAFNRLSECRRKYMHFIITTDKDPDADAREAYRQACFLVNKTFGLGFENGKIRYDPAVMAFIQDVLVVGDSTACDASSSDESTF